jgi:hypothetical protein
VSSRGGIARDIKYSENCYIYITSLKVRFNILCHCFIKKWEGVETGTSQKTCLA